MINQNLIVIIIRRLLLVVIHTSGFILLNLLEKNNSYLSLSLKPDISIALWNLNYLCYWLSVSDSPAEIILLLVNRAYLKEACLELIGSSDEIARKSFELLSREIFIWRFSDDF